MQKIVDLSTREEIVSKSESCIFLEAGAGTGKTKLIVDKILQIISSGIARIDELIVITFTEKAANEIRSRIREQLQKSLTHALEHERNNYYLAIEKLPSSQISTIHSFTSSILRTYPIETGITPNFVLLNKTEDSIDFEERWEQWLTNLSKDDSLEISNIISLGMNFTQIFKLAKLLNENRELNSPSPPKLLQAKLVVKTLKTYLLEGKNLLTNCLNPADNCLKVFQLLRSLVNNAAKAINSPDHNLFFSQELYAITAPPDGIIIKKGNKNNWSDHQYLDELRKIVQKVLEELICYRLNVNQFYLCRVIKTLQQFLKDATTSRHKEGKINFDDLLILTRQLLENHPIVRQTLKERIKFLFIDEFQDTDVLQAEIIFLLTTEEIGIPNSFTQYFNQQKLSLLSGKLFLVGDPKQSIYRFRKADINLFYNAKQIFNLEKSVSVEIKTISQNFRSAPQIIHWINNNFSTIIKNYKPMIPYRPPSYQQSVYLLYPQSNVEDKSLKEIRRHEATTISRQIIGIVNNKLWKISNSDPVTEEFKEITFSDICILVNDRNEIELYTHEFDSLNIPYILDSGKQTDEHQELRELYAILHTIDDPSDQIATVAALKASVFSCSDRELMEHHSKTGSFNIFSKSSNNSIVERALLQLREFHKLKLILSTPNLIEHIIAESFLIEPLLFSPELQQTARAFSSLIEQVEIFCQQKSDSLRMFLKWNSQREKNDLNNSGLDFVENDTEALRIMTIHGAKGLEFPVVILPKLSCSLKDKKSSLVNNDNKTIEFRFTSRSNEFTTSNYEQTALNEEILQDQENARKMYVATTRAKDILIIPVFKSEKLPGYYKFLPKVPSQKSIEKLKIDEKLPGAQLIMENIIPLKNTKTSSINCIPQNIHAEWQQQKQSRDRVNAPLLQLVAPSKVTFKSNKDSYLKKLNQLSTPLQHDDRIINTHLEHKFLLHGSSVHEVLAKCDFKNTTTASEWSRKICKKNDCLDLLKDVERDANRILESISMKRVISSIQYIKEMPIVWMNELNNSLVEGFIDLAFEETDGWIIIDYKTDSNVTSKELLNKYKNQLQIYRSAVSAAGIHVKSCGLWSTKTGKIEIW